MVGGLLWELKTGGRLGRLDRLRLVASVLQVRLARQWRRLRSAFGDETGAPAPVDVARIRIPDSVAALQALEHARAVSPPWLLHHCVRTYLFGALLGLSGRVAFDEELLYVTSLLHDLGLTGAVDARESHCFAVGGARAAYALSHDWGWPERRREALREAIVLHVNPALSRRHGAEAYLLHGAAGLDVLGAGREVLAPADVQAVFARHPRLDVGREIAEAMRREARRHPEGRIAFYERYDLTGRIERAWGMGER